MRGDFTEWQLSRASEIPQFKLNSHNGSLRSEIRNSEQRRLAIVRLWEESYSDEKIYCNNLDGVCWNSNSETNNLQREDWNIYVRCVLNFIYDVGLFFILSMFKLVSCILSIVAFRQY